MSNIGELPSGAFRQARSTADAIEQSFKLLSRELAPEWVMEGDLQGCFDNISHRRMLQRVPTDAEVLHLGLATGCVEKRTPPTEAGTPQGGIISPTSVNMTLDGSKVS